MTGRQTTSSAVTSPSRATLFRSHIRRHPDRRGKPEVCLLLEQGAVYLFSWNGTSWVQQAEIVANNGAADDGFGTSVAISGTTFGVGASGVSSYQGAAYFLHP